MGDKMKTLLGRLALVASLGLVLSGPASAETADGSKMQFNFTEDGKNFIRLLTWHQLWGRMAQMNPGTTVNGQASNNQVDIGIRRSRFLVFGKVADRMSVVFHFGINNQTFNGAKKPQLYVHDVWTQYDIIPTHLSLGVGLHYWNGISRMSNWSTIKFLALDAPISNWPTIEKSDQFARQLGIYAKGKLGKLDYRLALNRPFKTGTLMVGAAADYNPENNSPAVAGYFMYQFWEQEGNLLPYLPGTYIGKKSVFNLGSGFYYHPKAMISDAGSGIQTHDSLAVAGDVYLDMPVGEGAITAYGVYMYTDFGPHHLRNVGIMNLGAGGTSVNGRGNAYPTIGTGHTFYGQAGYLLPMLVAGAQVQPYVSAQISSFDALDALAIIPEVGMNWFVHGHSAKFTVMYRARPIFEVDDGMKKTVDTYKGEVVAQTQLFF